MVTDTSKTRITLTEEKQCIERKFSIKVEKGMAANSLDNLELETALIGFIFISLIKSCYYIIS